MKRHTYTLLKTDFKVPDEERKIETFQSCAAAVEFCGRLVEDQPGAYALKSPAWDNGVMFVEGPYAEKDALEVAREKTPRSSVGGKRKKPRRNAYYVSAAQGYVTISRVEVVREGEHTVRVWASDEATWPYGEIRQVPRSVKARELDATWSEACRRAAVYLKALQYYHEGEANRLKRWTAWLRGRYNESEAREMPRIASGVESLIAQLRDRGAVKEGKAGKTQ